MIKPLVVSCHIETDTEVGIRNLRVIVTILEDGFEAFVKADRFGDSQGYPMPYQVQKRRIFSVPKDYPELAIYPARPVNWKTAVYYLNQELNQPPTPREMHLLNMLKLVIVPTRRHLEFLRQNGLRTPIESLERTGVLEVLKKHKILVKPVKNLSPVTSERDLIINYYRQRATVPRQKMGDWGPLHLTNTPKGLGDTLLLTVVPDKSGINTCYSSARSFKELMRFNPYYDSTLIPSAFVSIAQLYTTYDLGPGHLIQRIHRALKRPVPVLPKGYLGPNAGGVKKTGLVGLHFVAGDHASWQQKYVHPRARTIYPENVELIRRFAKESPQYSFIEYGGERSGYFDDIAEDMTKHLLADQIGSMGYCEYFLSIISGPMHVATAAGCKCITIINFPSAKSIFLPTLKDISLIESEWFYPQNVHLHQDDAGPLVPKLTMQTLKGAFDGAIYPYWKHDQLTLINEQIF